MVAVRKFMEKFFTVHDLKYLDDKMPEFHLRKKEDMKKKKQVSGRSLFNLIPEKYYRKVASIAMVVDRAVTRLQQTCIQSKPPVTYMYVCEWSSID
jgi:hypothetical protein